MFSTKSFFEKINFEKETFSKLLQKLKIMYSKKIKRYLKLKFFDSFIIILFTLLNFFISIKLLSKNSSFINIKMLRRKFILIQLIRISFSTKILSL